MPRNYIRKTNRGLTYSREALREAVARVRAGRCNETQAALIYNIPLSTLSNHVTGKTCQKSKTMGCPPAIGEDDERTIAEKLRHLQTNGFHLSQKSTLELVGRYIKEKNIKNSLRHETPGIAWWMEFAKRHRLLKKPLHVEFGRPKANEVIMVKEFYSLIETRINQLGLVDKPGQIWHIEEHSFFNGKRVANTDKEDLTVVTAVNAEGKKAPLLTVFKGEERVDWMLGKHINIGHKRGMCSDVFRNYFSTFQNYIDETHSNLVIYDGKSSNIDLKVIEDAIKAKITMIKSPEFIEGLGLSVMNVLKEKWSKVDSNDQFSSAITDVFDDLEVFEIQEGFKNAGIHPFEICDAKFDDDRLRVYEEYEDFKTKLAADQTVIDVPEQLMVREMDLEMVLKREPDDYLSNVEVTAFPLLPENNVGSSSSTGQYLKAMVTVDFIQEPTNNPVVQEEIMTDVSNITAVRKLTDTNETKILTWVKDLTNAGFIITEENLDDAVENLAMKFGRMLRNKDQTAEELKRHNKVNDRISKLPIELTVDAFKTCIDRVKAYVKNEKLKDILNDPRRVFYCGKMKFHLKDIEKKVSVLVTSSADGDIQAKVIFNFVVPKIDRIETWTSMEIFADYLTEVVYPSLTAKNIPLPVIIFMDHAMQINLALTEFCQDKIVLIGLPKVHPFESVYCSLYGYWKDIAAKLRNFKKEDLGIELEKCVGKIARREIVKGFKDCGLYPFDLNVNYCN